MKSVSILAIFASAFLAGCASKPMDVASVTSIKPTNGESGLDVYERRRRNGEKVPEFTGDQIVSVRSYMALESGYKGKEFAGASCAVTARDFSAEVTTPAKVRVPIYRMHSSPLVIRCNHPEYQAKMVEVAVFNKTKAQRLSNGANGGLAGVLVMAAVNGLSDEKTHDFSYSPAQVVMTPLSSKPKPTQTH